MNYLAHIDLSGDDMLIAVGNFMGDGVKGAIPEGLHIKLRVGLHLHRFIDHQSDTHPANLEMRLLLRAKYSKYAGVVQDMYHDHFLSKYWEEYHKSRLEQYLQRFYDFSDAHLHVLPARQKSFYLGMKEGGWLMRYAELDGISRAFAGLSSRSSTAIIMKDGAHFLEEGYEDFEKGFRSWYPLLREMCEKEREVLLRNLSNS